MKEERLKQIENYINENKLCGIDLLCEKFNVSKPTIRRDLSQLEEMGVIRKVYGGIASVEKNESTVPYSDREINNKKRKDKIGQLACELINDGDTIFVDSGTTAIYIAKYLKGKRVNILTNNLNIINSCIDSNNIRIISCGGLLDPTTNSFVGEISVSNLKTYNISVAFMAATGVSIEYGVTNSSSHETPIKKMAMQKSLKSYALIDSSKWDKVSLNTYANLKDFTGIITNKSPDIGYVKYLEDNNIELLF